MYYIYILKCSDGTLYTGFTNDLKKRLHIHNTGKAGAKYTRGRRPVEMIYFEEFQTKGKALKREWEIKKMKKEKKLLLKTK